MKGKNRNLRSWLVVAIVAAITVFFAIQLPKTTFDNDVFNFVPKTNPARMAISDMTKTYGSQVFMLIGLESRSGDIFNPDKFKKMKELTEKLKKLPNAASVTGIMDTQYIRAEGKDIVVDPLVPADFSGTPAEIALVKEKILSWDVYRRSLVSDDYTSTEIMINLDSSTDDSANWKNNIDPKRILYAQVKDVIASTDLGGFNVYISGMPVFTVLFTDNLRKDLVTLVPLVILVVVVTLLLSFRRLGGLFLPLVTVLVSTIWTMGLMALLGQPLSILSTVIPVIMVAVGSAYGIHIISHYYDELKERPEGVSPEENAKIIRRTVAKVGWPVTLAALTTLAGFASNAITTIVPMQVFGIFSGFGVLAAFGVALTLIPALLTIQGGVPARKPGKAISGAGPGTLTKAPRAEAAGVKTKTTRRRTPGSLGAIDAIEAIIARITSRPRTVIAFTLVILAVSVWGTSRVVVDNAIIEYFKDYTDISRSDRFLRTKFNGTKTFSFIVKGKNPGDLNNPDILGAMDGLATYLETCSPDVGKVISYTQFIKRINQVFNADEPAQGIVRSVPPVTATAAAAGGSGTQAAGSSTEPAFGFGDASGSSGEPAFGFDAPAAPEPVAPAAKSGIATKAKAQTAKTPESQGAVSTVASRSLDLDSLNAAFARTGSATPSASEWLAELNRARNYRGAAYYEIPTDPARYGLATKDDLSRVVSNYLVLLGDGTKNFSNDPVEPSEALLTVQTRSTGNIGIHDIVEKGKAYAAEHFPEGYTITAAGPAMVEKSITDSIIFNQILSVVVSLVAVFLIMVVFYRSIAAGLIALIPLSVSILFNFCVMGLTGIKLNISTAIVASLAIGIGIDYTIHYISAYRHERLKTADLVVVKERAIRSSGRAIIFNAVAVGAGFAVLAASQFNPLMFLGILIALTMATSSLAALVILPVVLDLFKPAFLMKPLWFEKEAGTGVNE